MTEDSKECALEPPGVDGGLEHIWDTDELCILAHHPPTFVRRFADSNVAVGLIFSIWALSFSIPRVLVANHVEGLGRAKPYILKVIAGERISWLVLAVLVFFAGSAKPAWLLPPFFPIYFVATSSGGLTPPVWMDLVARAVS